MVEREVNIQGLPNTMAVMGNFVADGLTAEKVRLLPRYSSSDVSGNVSDFFSECEELAQHFGWSQKDLYVAVKLQLSGEAKDMCREQHRDIKDYASLKQILVERYGQEKDTSLAAHEFFSFMQPPTMPVSVFIAKAQAMSFKAFCPGIEDGAIEEKYRRQMMKGMLFSNLCPEVRRGVITANPQTVEEIKAIALREERAWTSCRGNPKPELEAPVYAATPSEEVAALKQQVFILSKKIEEMSCAPRRVDLPLPREGHIRRDCPRRDRRGNFPPPRQPYLPPRQSYHLPEYHLPNNPFLN